jgi:hypothetical protein
MGNLTSSCTNCFNTCFRKNKEYENFVHEVDEAQLKQGDDLSLAVEQFKISYKELVSDYDEKWKAVNKSPQLKYKDIQEVIHFKKKVLDVQWKLDEMRSTFTTDEDKKKQISKKAEILLNNLLKQDEERESNYFKEIADKETKPLANSLITK